MSDSENLMSRMQHFVTLVPHNRALGIEVVELQLGGTAIMKLPYRAELVGQPDTGVLHGGAITSLLDACCGAAVFLRIARPISIATLDLRIDYLKPATPNQDVFAKAECFHTTRNVAFLRALAYHEEQAPIAAASATFMLGAQAASRSPIAGAS